VRTAVFVPAYESEHTIEAVVDRIPAETYRSLSDILIQDDGSRDRTLEACERLARRYEKVRVVSNPRNLGYGGTLKKAMRDLRDGGFDCMLMLHADLQYAPEAMDDMLQPIRSGAADVVLGSRMLSGPLAGGMPVYKWLGNRTLTWTMNVALARRLTDYHTGYVALSGRALSSFDFARLGDGHEISAQMLIESVRKSLAIVEVPIATYYGPETRSCSFATSVRYGLTVLGLLAADRWSSFAPRPVSMRSR